MKIFKRRFLAFLIDFIIAFLIFKGITLLLPKNSNLISLESELSTLNERYIKKEINNYVYINRYANIILQTDKERIPETIINTFLIIIYFILVPYYWDGKTIGMKILKIRIKKENDKLGINDLAMRSIIINGIGSTLVSLCSIFLFKDIVYFWIILICGIIQFLLVIISGFMVIYRHDEKGIHDLLSGTQVIKEG